MFEFRSAHDDNAALSETAPADTGSRDASRSSASRPVPRVEPVQFQLSGSYSMDGMTAVLPGLFQTPEFPARQAGSPSAAGQLHASKTDKPGRKKG